MILKKSTRGSANADLRRQLYNIRRVNSTVALNS